MSNDGLERVYAQRTVPMGQLGQIRYLILSSRVAIETSLVTSYPDYIKQQGDLVEKNIAEVANLWDQYLSGRLTADEQALAKPVMEQYQQLVRGGIQPSLAALRAADLGEAGTLAVEKMRPLSDPVLSGLNALTKLQLYRGNVEHENATKRYHAAVMIGIAAVAAGILIAALVGFFLIRALSRALGNAVRWADAVAAGDLTMQVETDSNNEIGRLLRAMKAMNAGLVRIVSEVRSSTQSISGASSQIAAGNLDLSLAHRGAGQLAGGDRRLDGGADRDRQAERRQRAPGQPAGRSALRQWRSRAARWSRQVVDTMGVDQRVVAARSPTSSASSTASPSRPTSWR